MFLDKLQAASYKGIPFLVDGNQTLEGGRKGQTHDYVNQDERLFEDLGRSPDVFSVTGIVHGQDFLEQANNLRRALNTKGAGILVHPFWGEQRVINKSYTVGTDTKSVGLATFSITFEVARTQQIFPTDTFNNSVAISDLSTRVSDLIKIDFAAVWDVENIGSININDALTKIDDVIDLFDNVSTTVFQSIDNINDFSDLVRVFDQNKITDVLSGLGLSTDLFNIFDRYKILASEASDQYLLTKRMFNFGDTDSDVPLTTLPRIQREQNRRTLNQTMQLNSLVQAYGTVPSLTFKTDVELKETQQELDTQFDRVTGSDSPFSTQTLEGVKELRSEVRQYFDGQLSNVYRITDIQTNETPMTILGYRYYGDTTEVDDLIDLNGTIDVSHVEGDVKVFAK